MSNDITPYGGGLPVPRRGSNAAKSIALIRASVECHAEIFKTANYCEKLFQTGTGLSQWGITTKNLYGNVASESRVHTIAEAITDRARLLPSVPLIGKAIEQFKSFVMPEDEDCIDPTQAGVMVRALIGSIAGNRRSAEDKERIEACVTMFDPMVSIIGSTTELWGEIPRHPVVVAIGIMSMLYKKNGQTFTPSPHELADAIRRAHEKLDRQLSQMQRVIEELWRREQIAFDHTREEWAAVLTTRDSLNAARIVGLWAENSLSKWGQQGRWDNYYEWKNELDNIEARMDYSALREAASKNGVDVEDVPWKEGEPLVVPDGVTLKRMPNEITTSWLKNSEYFVSQNHIMIVIGEHVVEVIDRVPKNDDDE